MEQGPAATEEAASFGGMISFSGKKLRQSYDAVARFQLESRAGNRDFIQLSVINTQYECTIFFLYK